jgi:phosphatidylserine decarboxylase
MIGGELMERVFATDFAHMASHLMGKASQVPLPAPILKQVIHAYAIATGVSMEEIDPPQGGFKNFSEFFGRRLLPGARDICKEQDALVSPCDGKIIAVGDVDSKDSPSFSIKGSRYNLDALLGAEKSGASFRDGGYLIVYLHPRDYHRVHVPVGAALTAVRHVPGARYPVNSMFEDRVEEIYGKNERVVFHFNLPSGLEFALIMVSAFGVGNIETPYESKDIMQSTGCREHRFDEPIPTVKGDDLGTFLLGSTVVLIWAQNAFKIDDHLVVGPITMGSRLGRTIP